MRMKIGIATVAAGTAVAAGPPDFTTLRHAKTIGDPSFRHAGAVTCVRFLPDGKRVLSAAQDGTARLWDVATRREIRRFPMAEGADVWDVVLRRGGGEILTAAGGGAVIRWDLESARELARYKHPDTAFRIAEFPDGASFVSTDNKGGALRWAWDGAAPLATYSIPKGSVYAAAIAGGGTRLITGGSDGKGPCWWDAAGGGRIGFLSGLTGTVHTVALSPDGKAVAVCAEHQVAVLDPASGAVAWTHAFPKEAYVCAWSPDGSRLAVTAEGRVHVFSAADGEHRAQVDVGGRSSWAVAWSPDGATLLCGAGSGIAVVDAASAKRVFPPEGAVDPEGIGGMAVSADGSRVWVAGDASMRPLDPGTGVPGAAVAFPDERSRAWVTLDGRYVIAAARYGAEKPYAVLDAEGGAKVAELAVAESYVATGIASDAAGSNVFAIVGNQEVRQFSVPGFAVARDWSTVKAPSRRPAAPDPFAADGVGMLHSALGDDEGPRIGSLAVSPGGRHLAAGCRKGTVVVWDLATGRRWPDMNVGGEDIDACLVTDGDAPVLVVVHRREMLALPLAPGAGGPAEAEVKARIQRLGSDTHAEREEATRGLAAMGEALRPFLRLWTWDDPEIAERLRKIEAGLDGEMAAGAPAVALAVPGGIGSPVALPGCDAWAAIAGGGADAEVWICALRDGEIRVTHRIRTGRGPAVLQWLAGARQLWVGNRDGTIDRFDLP